MTVLTTISRQTTISARSIDQELGDLRTTLNQEVEQLRTEFQGLRSTLNQQLEATANLASVEDEDGDSKE